MSRVSTINNNDNNKENTLKEFESAFPDPTEDIFWQKVSTVTNVGDDDSTNDVRLKYLIVNWLTFIDAFNLN